MIYAQGKRKGNGSGKCLIFTPTHLQNNRGNQLVKGRNSNPAFFPDLVTSLKLEENVDPQIKVSRLLRIHLSNNAVLNSLTSNLSGVA